MSTNFPNIGMNEPDRQEARLIMPASTTITWADCPADRVLLDSLVVTGF